MKLIYCNDYQEMSKKAARSLIDDLKDSSERWIGMATGNSPKGIYAELVEEYRRRPEIFDGLGIVKLDEWGGIPMDSEDSCEHFLKKRIIDPLNIRQNRYVGFDSLSENPEEECERVQLELKEIGQLDTCILGLGKNGHLGFNEPKKELRPGCHKAELSKTSQGHSMVANMAKKPDHGLTLGMADILTSKQIIVLVTGSGKEAVFKQLMTKKISTYLPASFLWLHLNTECYVDSTCF